MLNVEIKINGQIVGFLNIRNEGTFQEDLCNYSLEGFIDGERLLCNKIVHYRKDGALELIRRAIIQLNKEINNGK